MRLDGAASTSSGPHPEVHAETVSDDDGSSATSVERTGPLARALASVRGHASVADSLRLVGTLLLVAGLSSFLLAGVEVRNDLQRFGLLLAQTATFAGVAFALVRWLEDARGARLLLGVAALSVPAAFAVLGAMLYSLVSGDVTPGSIGGAWSEPAALAREMPAFARWRPGSSGELAIAGLAAAVTLVPTTFFALAVLDRGSARRRGAATLLASAFLLVPLRDPTWAGLLMLASGAVAALLLHGSTDRGIGPRTPGGRFARALPFVPAIVIGGRTMLVDGPEPAFLTLGALAVLLAVRATLKATGPTSGLHVPLLPLGTWCAAAAATQALRLVDLGSPETSALLPFAAVAIALVEFGRCSAAARTIRLLENLWGTGLLACAAFWAVLGPSGHAAIVLIVPALAVTGLATWRGRAWLGVFGSLTCIWGVLWLVGPAVEWMADHAWLSLAATGLAAVIGASVVQRHGPVIAARARGLHRRRFVPSPDARTIA